MGNAIDSSKVNGIHLSRFSYDWRQLECAGAKGRNTIT